MLTTPNASAAYSLGLVLGKANTNAALTLRLYTNAITPSQDTVVGDLVEASFAGYAGIACPHGDWTVTPDAAGGAQGPAVALCVAKTFSFSSITSPQTVRGYYLTRADGSLAWLEPLDGGDFAVTGTGSLVVTPRITLQP